MDIASCIGLTGFVRARGAQVGPVEEGVDGRIWTVGQVLVPREAPLGQGEELGSFHTCRDAWSQLKPPQ